MLSWLWKVVIGALCFLGALVLICLFLQLMPTVTGVGASNGSGAGIDWSGGAPLLLAFVAGVLTIGLLVLLYKYGRTVLSAVTSVVLIVLGVVLIFALYERGLAPQRIVTYHVPQTMAGQVTNQCPGTFIESLPLGSALHPLSREPCQVRIKIVRGASVMLYGKNGSKIGTYSRRTGNVDGITYSVSAPQGEVAEIMVTICPLGSPGSNQGSCT